MDSLHGSTMHGYTYTVHPTATPASKKAVAEADASDCGATRQASNDEVERRGVAPTTNEADLFQIIDSLLGSPKTLPRDRSNRLLECSSGPMEMRA